MAARAYWKGYLKLSLVSCPVKLYSAVSSSSKISFNQLHKDTLNRVNMKYHDPELGEIDRADLVKGYQFEKDRYVIVTKEELDSIQIESSKTIDIEGFVDADEIEDVYVDSPYYLGPDGPVAEETFTVIREALARAHMVGVGRIVLAGRERVIVISPRGPGFLVTTLRTAKDVRDIDAYVDTTGADVNEDLLAMAETIIASKKMTFDPSAYEDRYETALLDLVKAKIAGEEPVVSKAPEQGDVINLMDALKRSIEQERRPAAASKPKSTKPRPAAKLSENAEEADEAEAPKPAKKTTTAKTTKTTATKAKTTSKTTARKKAKTPEPETPESETPESETAEPETAKVIEAKPAARKKTPAKAKTAKAAETAEKPATRRAPTGGRTKKTAQGGA